MSAFPHGRDEGCVNVEMEKLIIAIALGVNDILALSDSCHAIRFSSG